MAGKTSVTLELDPMQKRLLRRGMGKGGKGELLFASEVARLSDPYVPMRTGDLKNNTTIRPGSITYHVPYATKQYETNRGGNNGPLRGKHWDRRMWADRGDEIIRTVAEFCGGEAE
ncbi:MAG: minor capsid protein [Clostridiales Family XIII bacterium]|jgi:hypothetical protein|nr:minor capsid protein [Clostridiales Family XIII bacterium]